MWCPGAIFHRFQLIFNEYQYCLIVCSIVWFFDSLIIWLISCVEFLGPGPLGAPGPRCRIRVATVTTYCQASYLLSGKLPTVRQAFSRYETSYLLSGKLPTVRQAFSRSQASYLLSGKPSAVVRQATYCQTSLQPLWNLTQLPHACTQLWVFFDKPVNKHNLLNMLI